MSFRSRTGTSYGWKFQATPTKQDLGRLTFLFDKHPVLYIWDPHPKAKESAILDDTKPACLLVSIARVPQGFWGNKGTREIWQWKHGNKAKNCSEQGNNCYVISGLQVKARLFEGDPFNPLIFYTEGVVEINVKNIGGSLEETVRGDGNIELTETEFIRCQSRTIECMDPGEGGTAIYGLYRYVPL